MVSLCFTVLTLTLTHSGALSSDWSKNNVAHWGEKKQQTLLTFILCLSCIQFRWSCLAKANLIYSCQSLPLGKSFLFLLFSAVSSEKSLHLFHRGFFCLVSSADLSAKEVDWSGNSGNSLGFSCRFARISVQEEACVETLNKIKIVWQRVESYFHPL